MKLKCLLIDVEPIAQDIIESYIERIEILEVAGKCSSAVEAFTILHKQTIDLIFLDIQMPELTGLEFLRALANPPKAIITTAFREYAADSYELGVLDYLVKPVSFERFMKAVGKITQPMLMQQDAPMNEKANNEPPFIFIKEDRKLVRVRIQDIIYLESQRDYVLIATAGKLIRTRHTLQYFEELLPKKLFVRIHRSFIIAVAKIQSVSENRIEAGGKELMIGGNYKQDILDKLNIR